MNPNAEKWCKVLEENKIPQGAARLAKGDKRCCLGVLMDLYMENNPGEFIKVGDEYFDEYEEPIVFLPALDVTRWAGLRTATGEMDVFVSGSKALCGLNDSGKTFPEIAAIIRSEPAGLFV